MRENSIEPRVGQRLCTRGFTLPELVIVMILAGLMAAYAMPKFESAMSLRNDAWRDQVQAAMRYAQKTAVSHRRLVCAGVAGSVVNLTIATVRGSTTCNGNLAGPDGVSQFGSSGASDVATTVSPAGTIYFQPDGRVTSDAAGVTTSTRTFTFTGAPSLVLYGETGYAQ